MLQKNGARSMEAKSNQKRLDDLPRSDSSFWEHAEVHTNIVKIDEHDILSKKGHDFERITGHQAECRICHWGFQLDPGDKIIEGHLYNIKGRKII